MRGYFDNVSNENAAVEADGSEITLIKRVHRRLANGIRVKIGDICFIRIR